MILVHDSQPRSYLKAVLLSRVHKGLVMHYDDYRQSFFQMEEVLDVDGFSFAKVYEKYESAFGPVPWLIAGKQIGKLLGSIHYASRHKAEDRHRLIILALNQALDKGPEYVLAKVSPEGATFLTRARQVYKELQRVQGFARLTPLEEQGMMIGRVELEHHIGDLVVKYFLRKFQGYRVVLLVNGLAYYNEGSRICIVDEKELGIQMPEDDFAAYWDAYYDTQWIEGRLNPQLAKKHLPKKFWGWVREGKKLDLPHRRD